jgi:hypothetical protein
MADYQLTTRRALLGGSIPLLGGGLSPRGADPTIDACRNWLALEAERSRLETEWLRYGKLLSQKFRWHELTDAERDLLPETRILDGMNARLEALDWRSDALLRALPTTPAASTAAVAANLMVAKTLLNSAGEPDVHGLIVRAVRDLETLNFRRDVQK